MAENTYSHEEVIAILREPYMTSEGHLPPMLPFRSVTLCDFDFQGMDLSAVCFDGSLLLNCNFNGCDLDDASFRDATLHRSTFERSSLINADLQGVKAFRTNFKEAILVHTKLDRGDFTLSCFRDAILDEVTCAETEFHEAELPANFNP